MKIKELLKGFTINPPNVVITLFINKGEVKTERWEEKIHTSEIGEEHKLTCIDLYRIRKMCNISDIE